MKFAIEKTDLFKMWFETQNSKVRRQIDARLNRIATEGHFGHFKSLGDGVSEIKFNNGNRIYFTIEKRENDTVICLLGGNKNGQSKDIAKAKNLIKK